MGKISEVRRTKSLDQNLLLNLLSLLLEGRTKQVNYTPFSYTKQVELKLNSLVPKRSKLIPPSAHNIHQNVNQFQRGHYERSNTITANSKQKENGFLNHNTLNTKIRKINSFQECKDAKKLQKYINGNNSNIKNSNTKKILQKQEGILEIREQQQQQHQRLPNSQYINQKFKQNQRQLNSHVQFFRKRNQEKYKKQRDSFKAFKNFQSNFVQDQNPGIKIQNKEEEQKVEDNNLRKKSQDLGDFIAYQNYKPRKQEVNDENDFGHHLKRRPQQLQIDELPRVEKKNNLGQEYQQMNNFISASFEQKIESKKSNWVNNLDDQQRIHQLEIERQMSQRNVKQVPLINPPNIEHQNSASGAVPRFRQQEEKEVPKSILSNQMHAHGANEDDQKQRETQLQKLLRESQIQFQKEQKRKRDQELQASMVLIRQLERQEQNRMLNSIKKQQAEQQEQKASLMLIRMLEQQEQKRKHEQIKKQQAEQQQSIKLAKQLQNEQFQLQQEEQKKIEQNVICKICLMQIEYKQYDPLQGCGHLFHKQCISFYLKNQIDIRKFPIKCPLSECGIDMTDWDIRSRIDQDNREKYKKYTFENFIQRNPNLVSCCPTPDCQNVFAFEEGDIQLRCTICNGHYCLDCKTNWHTGMTCQEYRISANFSEEDKKFIKFVKGSNFKKCPRCKFWVERSEGCDHMTCRCGAEFCYQCGGPYRRCKCRGYDIQDGGGDDDDY